MEFDLSEPKFSKPLAGTCHHRWHNLESPYYQAQLCELCKLYRYKAGKASDWEFRAPIPRAPMPSE